MADDPVEPESLTDVKMAIVSAIQTRLNSYSKLIHLNPGTPLVAYKDKVSIKPSEEDHLAIIDSYKEIADEIRQLAVNL